MNALALVAALSTCSALTPDTYPADSTSWFDPARHRQVVFYAHLLFPLEGGTEDKRAPAGGEAWRPPLRWRDPPAARPPRGDGQDAYYAEADWYGPDGERIAAYGLTMAARAAADYVRLQGRSYIPHTFAMAVGIKDLRSQAGQARLPEKPGQYHVRFFVDGEAVGLAFFRILGPSPGAAGPAAPKPTATATPLRP